MLSCVCDFTRRLPRMYRCARNICEQLYRSFAVRLWLFIRMHLEHLQRELRLHRSEDVDQVSVPNCIEPQLSRL